MIIVQRRNTFKDNRDNMCVLLLKLCTGWSEQDQEGK